MEKKLEDYLHFHLGCQFQYADGLILTLSGLVNIFGELHAEGMATPNKTSAYPLYTIKPILRKLSDISIDELTVLQIDSLNELRGNLGDLLLKTTDFLYLLNRHFDLFNLIPEGLAIDKNNQ